MIVAFAALRVYAVAGVDPMRYSDTGSYLSFDLLGDAPRLWTVPLLYTLLPNDDLRVIGQLVIAIGCWATLAAVVAGLPENRWVARAGAAGVLAIGLTRTVTQWDLVLLSESVATSLSVLVVAALLLVAQRRTRATLVLLGVALTFWAFTRHINLIVLFTVLPVALVVVVWRMDRVRGVALAGVLLVLGAWGAFVMSREENVWKLNSYSVLVSRMLPYEDRTQYFTDRGLQVTPEMRQGTLNARGPLAPGFRDPDTQAFLRDQWRGAYLGWLLRNPGYAVFEPWKHAREPLSPEFAMAAPRTVLPELVQKVAFSRATGRVALWLLAVGALWAVAWWLRRQASAVDAVAAALVALALVSFALVWHTSWELARPALPIAVTLRLALLVLVVLAIGRLVSGSRWPTSSTSSS